MGTLSHQAPRGDYLKKEDITGTACEIKQISTELKITYMEALETYKALALINGYDTKDEQLAGFGDLAQEFIDAFYTIHTSEQ